MKTICMATLSSVVLLYMMGLDKTEGQKRDPKYNIIRIYLSFLSFLCFQAHSNLAGMIARCLRPFALARFDMHPCFHEFMSLLWDCCLVWITKVFNLEWLLNLWERGKPQNKPSNGYNGYNGGWPSARLFGWSAADWSRPATNKSIRVRVTQLYPPARAVEL